MLALLLQTINSIKVTEVQLAKYDTRNRKYLKDMEVLADKQAELEASLMAHEAEKLRLQKELVRNETKFLLEFYCNGIFSCFFLSRRASPSRPS